MFVAQCGGEGVGRLCLPDNILAPVAQSRSQSCRVPLAAGEELHRHVPRGCPLGCDMQCGSVESSEVVPGQR